MSRTKSSGLKGVFEVRLHFEFIFCLFIIYFICSLFVPHLSVHQEGCDSLIWHFLGYVCMSQLSCLYPRPPSSIQTFNVVASPSLGVLFFNHSSNSWSEKHCLLYVLLNILWSPISRRLFTSWCTLTRLSDPSFEYISGHCRFHEKGACCKQVYSKYCYVIQW